MTNYYLLILGYFLIFLSIIFFIYRLKRINLTKEDYESRIKFEKVFQILQTKIFYFFKISKKEVKYIMISLKEKILRRIKIEALKIETWANKKLEGMKEKQNFDEEL